MVLYYDKNLAPLNINLPIHIYGSSSNGNSIVINPINTMVDLGFAYSHYDQRELLSLDYIILTHEHGDHLNPSTLKKIAEIYPNITILVSNYMKERLRERFLEAYKAVEKNLTVLEFEIAYPFITRLGESFEITMHSTSHGPVINSAIEISIFNSQTHLLYASDLDKIEPDEILKTNGLPNNSNDIFNLIMLEANYDEDEIYEELAIAQAQNLNTAKIMGNFRHISQQDSIDYAKHHLTDGGVYVPLHASPTFGTYIQNLD